MIDARTILRTDLLWAAGDRNNLAVNAPEASVQLT